VSRSETFEALFDSAFLARLERLAVVSKHASATRTSGARRSRRMGDGLEFADHRDYAPGDPLRQVDWSYLARMDRLMTRLFHEHSEGGLAIWLDCSASMAAGDGAMFTAAARITAVLAYVSLACHERLWLCPYGQDAPEPRCLGRRRETILEGLEFVADLSCRGRGHLADFARQFIRRADHPTTIMIVSDLLDVGPQLDDALAVLSVAGCDVSVLHVWDRATARPEFSSGTDLIDVETGRTQAIDPSESLLAEYASAWDAMVAAADRTCRARSAVFVSTPVEQPVEELMLLTLRRAGVLSGR
jgi:uncharacterized protein (DUF58 family)